VQVGANGAVGGHDEGGVGSGEEDLYILGLVYCYAICRGKRHTPMAMAGKMYFMRARTSCRPWCFEAVPLLVCRSMSPPSSVWGLGALELSSSVGMVLACGLGSRGEVSRGGVRFGAMPLLCHNTITVQQYLENRLKV